MSRFFIDSNSELWFTKADELGLNVIGMPYSINDDDPIDYDLGRKTNHKAFFDKLKKGAIAKTQALNVQNYIDYFEPVLKKGEDIIYVHFSSEMSGTFEQMKIAISELKEKYPNRKISTVDTKLISVGEALLAYDCAKMWKAGASDEEIVEYVEKHRENYGLYFLVDNLAHLRKGGRLSTASFVVGTMLNIKPVLKVNNEGKIIKEGVVKGLKAGVKKILEIIKNTGNNLYDHPIIIAHADAEDLANDLEKLLREEYGEKIEIWKQPIGPTVGTHCGPGSIGIAFHSSHR